MGHYFLDTQYLSANDEFVEHKVRLLKVEDNVQLTNLTNDNYNTNSGLVDGRY